MASSLQDIRAGAATGRRLPLAALRSRVLPLVGRGLIGVATALSLAWVLFLAPTTGKWATSFGSGGSVPYFARYSASLMASLLPPLALASSSA